MQSVMVVINERLTTTARWSGEFLIVTHGKNYLHNLFKLLIK